MKRFSASSNFLSVVLAIVSISFLQKFPTAFAKHHIDGMHRVPEHVVMAESLSQPQPVNPPLTVVEPQPVADPQPVVPPQPVVDPQQAVQAQPQPVPHPSENTFEIHVINHASAGADTVNVTCTPGPPPGTPPPPTPPLGPPVPPHLLKVEESFSWTFEYPDPSADISYSCLIDWTGYNQGLVTLFNKDTYTDAECKSDNGNQCFWAIAHDGFYFSNKDGPFPGPNWTFRWPWGL